MQSRSVSSTSSASDVHGPIKPAAGGTVNISRRFALSWPDSSLTYQTENPAPKLPAAGLTPTYHHNQHWQPLPRNNQPLPAIIDTMKLTAGTFFTMLSMLSVSTAVAIPNPDPVTVGGTPSM